MTSQYHMDLTQFRLAQFRHVLETSELLPSEQILGEELPERFATLASMGINNLQDLTAALRTKKKLAQFAQESGLPQDYLTVLRRRAGTYTPRPVPLQRMPGVDPVAVERLAGVGIKDSRQLFARVQTRQERDDLAAQAGVPGKALLVLTKLSDLVRAPYVGPVFARLFYEASVDTLGKLATSPPDELAARIRAVNEEKGLTKAALPTAEHMASWLEIVSMIPRAIEY